MARRLAQITIDEVHAALHPSDRRTAREIVFQVAKNRNDNTDPVQLWQRAPSVIYLFLTILRRENIALLHESLLETQEQAARLGRTLAVQLELARLRGDPAVFREYTLTDEGFRARLRQRDESGNVIPDLALAREIHESL